MVTIGTRSHRCITHSWYGLILYPGNKFFVLFWEKEGRCQKENSTVPLNDKVQYEGTRTPMGVPFASRKVHGPHNGMLNGTRMDTGTGLGTTPTSRFYDSSYGLGRWFLSESSVPLHRPLPCYILRSESHRGRVQGNNVARSEYFV